jgi:mono/diheme cytochrome c family protein
VPLKTDVAEQTMKVYEPQESRIKTYRGYPVLPLLKKLSGEALGRADTVVFYCQDGYRADIPLSEFTAKPALLAFATADGTPFSLHGAKKEAIALAPYYLVWDHPNAASAAKDVYRWPYAVTKIGVVNSREAYKPLESPQQEGRALFMKHCFSCHALNGVGGQRGPPLDPFFTTQTDSYLRSYILDPKKMNKASKMSGLSPTLPDRVHVAERIIRYGKSLSGKTP